MHELRAMADGISKQFGLDQRLFAAIITVESAWRSYAVRFEPNFDLSGIEADIPHMAKENAVTQDTERMLLKFSWGLGQVMGATARWCGFFGPLPQLCEPYVGALWAARYLERLVKKYPNRTDAIAAYNAGSPRFTKSKEYVNQAYVDKVLKHL